MVAAAADARGALPPAGAALGGATDASPTDAAGSGRMDAARESLASRLARCRAPRVAKTGVSFPPDAPAAGAPLVESREMDFAEVDVLRRLHDDDASPRRLRRRESAELRVSSSSSTDALDVRSSSSRRLGSSEEASCNVAQGGLT